MGPTPAKRFSGKLRACLDCGAGSPPSADGTPARSCCACFRVFYAREPAAKGTRAPAPRAQLGKGTGPTPAEVSAAQVALAAAEKRAKAAEARAEAERKARLAAEAAVSEAKEVVAADGGGACALSAEQAARQKQLRAELKELRALAPALHARLFGGTEGHSAAIQVAQAELDTIAAKRGELPLQDQLDSLRRDVDPCTRAAAAAQKTLEDLVEKRKALDEQIAEGRTAAVRAAAKRGEAEAQLAALHSRLALEATPAAAAATGAPGFTPDDFMLFRGLLQHVDEAAIRATCQATGMGTPEALAARVATLTDKLRAAAAPVAVPAVPADPVGAAASTAAAGTPPPLGSHDDTDMDLDDEEAQLDRLLNEIVPEGPTADGGPPADRADARKRLLQQAARMVSRRVKGKQSA